MIPISVVSSVVKRSNGGGSDVAFDLVAGLHRLEACKSIGFTEIEASVLQLDEAEREPWEIDENLCRVELTELERGEHLMRRKETYERKWPQARQYVAGAVAKHEAIGHATAHNAVAVSSADVTNKIGLAERTIRQSISRAKRIDPKIRDKVRALPTVADNGAELDALAKLEPAQQSVPSRLLKAAKPTEYGRRKSSCGPGAIKPRAPVTDAARQKRRDDFVRAGKALDDDDRRWARGMLAEPN